MAHKITTPVLDAYGNSHTTDVYVKHDASITTNELERLSMPVSLKFYKTEADYTAGYSEMLVIEDDIDKRVIKNFQQTLTVEQATTIDPSMVAGFVLAYLKGIYGEGNVTDLDAV